MKNKLQKSDFRFLFAGYGMYMVTYTSPATGKKWHCHISDMTLIDDTKNAEEPKQKNLQILKSYCKQFSKF